VSGVGLTMPKLSMSPVGAQLDNTLCPPVEGSHGDTLEVSSARLCQMKAIFIAGSVEPQIRHLGMGEYGIAFEIKHLGNHLVPIESSKVTD